MTEINELEKKVEFHLNEASREKRAAEDRSTIDDTHTIEAIYHQNEANYYQNLIIIKNQEEILKYLKKE